MKRFVAVHFLIVAMMLAFLPEVCMAKKDRPLMMGGTREALATKIASEPWALAIYDDIVQSVQLYVDRHVS